MEEAVKKDYSSGWIDRERRKEREIRLLVERFEERLPALREVLGRYRVKEAYVFGSFASGGLRPGSDLDLAVSGAERSSWFRMSAELERAAMLNLDLTDLDLAPAGLKARILAGGRKIFP